jgi:hypothetical protein
MRKNRRNSPTDQVGALCLGNCNIQDLYILIWFVILVSFDLLNLLQAQNIKLGGRNKGNAGAKVCHSKEVANAEYLDNIHPFHNSTKHSVFVI